MNFGIGFVTCGRIQLTRKVGDSILKFNPIVKKYPWIIADDNSQPCVKMYFDELAKNNNLNMDYDWSEKREGANVNSKKLYTWAQKEGIDLMLILVNDFECTRRIDIPAIIKFFEEHPEAGQVQMFHWKGHIGDRERERSMENWVTKKPIDAFKVHIAGKETLLEANWLWTDGVNFTRIQKDVDYFDGAIGLPKEEKYVQVGELTKARNFIKTGLKIYEMQNQPFFNLDWDFKSQTPGRIP